MVFVINKHQNDEWFQYHSLSCTRLLNIGLNTEVYLHDLKKDSLGILSEKKNHNLKMCDTDYWYVTDSIFRHSRVSDILSCDESFRINVL